MLINVGVLYALFPHRFLSGVIKRPQWKTRTYKVIIYDLLQWKCGAILIPSGDDDVNGVANVDEEVNSLFLLEIRYDHNGFVDKTTVFYIVACGYQQTYIVNRDFYNSNPVQKNRFFHEKH